MKELLLLYNQYSNNWEEIPNESDRLTVVLRYLQHDAKRQKAIIENLIYSSDSEVVSWAATVIAYSFERSGNITKALQYYKKGGESILNNENLTDVIEDLPKQSRYDLAFLYHREGVMQFMNKNYNELIENFSKCPLLYKNSPLKQANSYLELASAYAKGKNRNKNKVMESLEKAEDSLNNFNYQSDEDKVSSYFLMKAIKNQQNKMQKNVWPDMGWYH